MHSPKVAVCIPTYNQGPFLRQAVESVLSQTQPNVEIWISDDASTDETPTLGRELQKNNPAIHYHRHPYNLGISANNNWLFAQPDAEFIVRLDSDDLLLPDYIDKTLRLLLKYSMAGYAHVTVQEIDEDGRNTRIRRLAGRGEYQNPEEALHRSIYGYRVAANICTFRGEVLRSLGCYRPGMNFAEDWDLSARIADAGWGNAYLNEKLACYRVWSRPKQQTVQRKIQELEGCICLYEETIEPAFQRRGWNTKVIQKQRQELALGYSLFLDAKWLTEDERSTIVEKLRELGESKWLTLRVVMLQRGWGGLFRWSTNLRTRLKDLVKSFLYPARLSSAENTVERAS